jgi:putative transposase
MPGRNIYKDYAEDSFYHVYNRGVDKQIIFKDDQDYTVFLSLIKRYLNSDAKKSINGLIYPNYSNVIELQAFCLMPNHFHLFIYQHDSDAMKKFMTSITVSYSMYFNKRYKRVGPVFQQRYRAVLIDVDTQFLHISRYIHLNPINYQDYEWSSYGYYLGQKHANWLKPDRVLNMFDGDYEQFVKEYSNSDEEQKDNSDIYID